jgi:5-methylcytosine-specific restriction endonuclease McrA
MAIMHEVRARRSGVEWEMVDLGVIFDKSGGICGICSQLVPFATFTVDHIKPLSKGGHHKPSNLQIAHATCNSSKGCR